MQTPQIKSISGERETISTNISSPSSAPIMAHKNSSKNQKSPNIPSIASISSISNHTNNNKHTHDDDGGAPKPHKKKVPVIKTNKVSSRRFSLGIKNRAKSVQNNEESIVKTNSTENS